jgi:hypothetical protein
VWVSQEFVHRLAALDRAVLGVLDPRGATQSALEQKAARGGVDLLVAAERLLAETTRRPPDA